MSRFVLTAQLQLQAPANTRQVVSQIQRQLQGGVNLNVNVQNAGRSQRQLQQLNQQVNNLNTAGQRMGRTFGVALRRFTAFAIASRGVSLFTNSLGNAINEAIDFERELVKVSQVTGKTLKQLDGLTGTITNLSVSLGVSSKELLSTTRILAQAGIQAADLDTALSALAKTSLSATFEDITKTAEGAVALLAQFGQGVGALEKQLSQISSVAGQFAVESGDLISAIRRTGGVFVSAGGELEEFLGLFTSIRATTRESAESIATGLRTILTRIQRPKTIEYLRQYGVELTDLTGKFVGPYEAVRRLSEAFAGLDQGDITFVRVAEELGGFRQIGKVIPLIQQFETAERARQAAIAGGESLTKDAITAQQALAVQFQKVREEFLALVRGISETGTFQILTKTALQLTSQLIKLVDAFKPLLPLIGAFAAFRLARGAGNFLSGVGAGLRNISTKNMGGPIGFATGGVVPGTGNRDTVPAMLTPGEFVIRKSSVNKIGAGTLAAMNENRYAGGGKVSAYDSSKAYVKYQKETPNKKAGSQFRATPKGALYANRFSEEDEFAFDLKTRNINLNKYKKFRDNKLGGLAEKYKKAAADLNDRDRGNTFELILDKLGIYDKESQGGSRLDGMIKKTVAEVKSTREALDQSSKGLADKMIGAAINPVGTSKPDKEIQKRLTEKKLTEGRDDLNLGNLILLQDITATELSDEGKERFANRSKKTKGSRNLQLSGGKFRTGQISENFFGGAIQKFAKGGSPSDTVPALLTPGEFVINKEAASRIGKANLETMNKKGVAGFAAGGMVSTGRNNYGAPVSATQLELFNESDEIAAQARQSAAADNEVQIAELSETNGKISELSSEVSGLKSSIADNLSSQKELSESIKRQMQSAEVLAKVFDQIQGRLKGGLSERKQTLDSRRSDLQKSSGALKGKNLSPEKRSKLEDDNNINKAAVAKAKQEYDSLAKELKTVKSAYEENKASILTSVDDLAMLKLVREENIAALEKATESLNSQIKYAQNLKTEAQASGQASKIPGKQSTFKEFSEPITEREGREDVARVAQLEKAKKAFGLDFAGKKKKAEAEAQAKMESEAKKGEGGSMIDCDLCGVIENLTKEVVKIGALINEIGRKLIGTKGKDGKTTGGLLRGGGVTLGVGAGDKDKVTDIEESITEGNTAQKEEARITKTIALLGGLNIGLANFVKSGDEAAKSSFNLANALQTGLTQFIAIKEAMVQIKEYADNNLTKESGEDVKAGIGDLFSKEGRQKFSNAELSKDSSLGQFFEGIKGKAKDRQQIGADLQTRGKARIQASGKGIKGLGGKALGKSQQLIGKAAGGIGKGLGKVAGFASKFAAVGLKAIPVVGQIIGAITSFSGALSAGFALQEKYNVAVKTGNVAKAEELAALKDFTGIEQALGMINPAFAEVSATLRGTTIESLKANAKYAALAAKVDLDKAKNGRLAADAMREVAAGSMSLEQALSGDASANFRGSLEARRAGVDANKKAEGTKSFGVTGQLRNVGNILSFGFMESASQKNANIDASNADRDKASKEALANEFESIFPSINDLGREFAAGGGTLQEFKAKLEQMGIPIDEVDGAAERVSRAFDNNLKSLERNRKAFQALNFGLTPLLKVGQGLNSSLSTLTSVSDGTYNALSNAKNVLETAATGGVVDDATFQSALDTVAKDLTAFGGGEQVGKITETISALRTGFEGAGPALEKFRQGLLSGDINKSDPIALRKGLTDTLTADIKDANAKKIIEDALADVELDPKEVEKIIASGNLDGLLKTLEEKGQEAFKELGPVIDNLVNSQNQLLGLTNKRIAAEQELINAQLNSADLQREAAGLIAEFSNKTLSGDEQANLAAGRLRATGINSQDAGALSATLALNTAQQQANAASLSATGDAALSGQDRASTEADQQNMATQNAEILTYARERVKIYQQEIAAAKNKLKLDQDAAKSLLSGDISKFSESINASIAADAFRSGDTSMLSGLGGEALSAGFDALTDEEKAASAGTLESLGISSGLADAAAGTSPEIEALQAEATKYAEIIAQSGDSSVQLANAALTAAQNLEELGRQALATAEADAAAKQAELDAEKEKSEKAAAQVEADRQAKLAAEEEALKKEEAARQAAVDAEIAALEEKRAAGTIGDNSQTGMGVFMDLFKQRAGGFGSISGGGYYSEEGRNYEKEMFADKKERETENQGIKNPKKIDPRSLMKDPSNYDPSMDEEILAAAMKRRGGTIYASRGMFIPRGTDTVPAMLTPGEFVVNRAAVQRGNNLQLLRAMNGGDTASNGAPAPSAGEGVAMARGGMVKYFNEGGEVGGGMSEFVAGFSQAIGQLGSAFGTFAQSVENLSNMKLSVSLAPTSVDVNVMGPLLSELSEQTKEIVLNAVVSEIKLNQLGNLERTV